MTPPSSPRTTVLVTAPAQGADPGVLHLEVRGNLDHDTSERFLTEVTAHLAAPGLRALRLNCADLDGIDSSGLSALLMLHRRTTAAGIRLLLESRTPALDRMLTITGTLNHLVPEHLTEAARPSRPEHTALRPTADDGLRADDPGQTATGPATHP
ncbi:STAS domain-containing protein [Kitasatospora sp. NPDC057223]|uniref:STAS domain-containing protein n=1 Tax=Kitasatospora sp. NPDC057223 TaxID=3346055 RepID=UPI00363FC4B3